jgi:hypothetical protein
VQDECRGPRFRVSHRSVALAKPACSSVVVPRQGLTQRLTSFHRSSSIETASAGGSRRVGAYRAVAPHLRDTTSLVVSLSLLNIPMTDDVDVRPSDAAKNGSMASPNGHGPPKRTADDLYADIDMKPGNAKEYEPDHERHARDEHAGDDGDDRRRERSARRERSEHHHSERRCRFSHPM